MYRVWDLGMGLRISDLVSGTGLGFRNFGALNLLTLSDVSGIGWECQGLEIRSDLSLRFGFRIQGSRYRYALTHTVP